MDYTEIVISIRRLIRAIDLDSKRSQKETGLSIPQLLSLSFISKQPEGQTTQLELRKHLNLNSSTVTGIVSRLVEKGFIARQPAKEDKRATRISITKDGIRILNISSPLLQEKLTKKLSQLPDEKLEEIQKNLTFLIQVLEAENIDASPFITSSQRLD
ncbi:MAG: MarR family transcriptional regulator [Crocinitomicaceae bacterium]|nr:MarR family transcriptional regulator [Crocinitomicaceae bacterium]